MEEYDLMSSPYNYLYLTEVSVVKVLDLVNGGSDILFDEGEEPDGLLVTVNVNSPPGADGTGLIVHVGDSDTLNAVHAYETRPTFIKCKYIDAANSIAAGQVIAVWLDH